MKKYKNIIRNAASALLALVAFSMTFVSCSSDDELAQDTTGKNVEITVGVTSGNVIDTRTNLEEEDGRMACTWAENDKLLVTNTSGEILSTLYIVGGVGQKTATFTGTLSGMTEGAVQLNFTYLGARTSLSSITSPFNVNLAEQDGLQATLNDYDIMSAQANVIISEGSASIASGITLNKLLAIGHFALQFPEGVTITDETVVISGTNLKNATTINLSNGSTSDSADGTIAIESFNGDFYLNLIPATGVVPKFTVTTEDGTVYEGTLAAKDIKAGDFIRLAKDQGIIVEMKTDEVIDHEKNPLLKWAETNLVYNHSTDKSTFATSYTDGGSLYQWGRNHGFADYKDAMGTYKSSNGTYQFGVYNKSYPCGKGFWNSYGDDIVSLRYTDSDDVTANKTLYMMSTVVESNSNDYWCFAGGGSNWNERAEKCAYNTPLCPDGWRMPTETDFAKIFPAKGINTSEVNLTSELNNYSELKEIAGVCKYVIRWDIETTSGKKMLKIRALVVGDSFKESELSSIDWADAEVVTRYFSATGAIEGFYHLHKIQSGYDVFNFPVAMPMPFGTWVVQAQGNASAMTVVYSNIVDAGKTYEGSYWVSDQKKVYRFREHQNSFGDANRNSFVGASVQPAYNAFAVRCVKDDLNPIKFDSNQ